MIACYNKLSEITINEMPINRILRKQQSIYKLFPPFDGRVDAVASAGGIRLVGEDSDSWHFTISSATTPGKKYNAYLHFSDLDNQILQKGQNKILWNKAGTNVDYNKLAAAIIDDIDVKIDHPDCPAFQYWGQKYISTQRQTDWKDPETRRPKIRNPKEYGMLCKHLQLLFDQLPFYTSTFAKMLKRNHFAAVEEVEDQAKATKTQVAAGADFLGGRMGGGPKSSGGSLAKLPKKPSTPDGASNLRPGEPDAQSSDNDVKSGAKDNTTTPKSGVKNGVKGTTQDFDEEDERNRMSDEGGMFESTDSEKSKIIKWYRQNGRGSQNRVKIFTSYKGEEVICSHYRDHTGEVTWPTIGYVETFKKEHPEMFAEKTIRQLKNVNEGTNSPTVFKGRGISYKHMNPDYLYHSSDIENFESIKANGIRRATDTSTKGKVYLDRNANNWLGGYSDRPSSHNLYRISIKSLENNGFIIKAGTDYWGNNDPDEMYVKKDIPGNMIDVYTTNGWKSLSSIEETLLEATEIWYHGSASGDLRGGTSGLHLGTKLAATQALNATIGIPVEGYWDGTREYGKTLLKGKNKLGTYEVTGYNVYAPQEDYYPDGKAQFSNHEFITLTMKPEIKVYRIIGKMTNTQYSPHSDVRANSMMRGQLKKGNAKMGYFYKNDGEDEGSISAVLPNGSHVQVIEETYSHSYGAFWITKNGEKIQLSDGQEHGSSAQLEYVKLGLTKGEAGSKYPQYEAMKKGNLRVNSFKDQIMIESWEINKENFDKLLMLFDLDDKYIYWDSIDSSRRKIEGELYEIEQMFETTKRSSDDHIICHICNRAPYILFSHHIKGPLSENLHGMNSNLKMGQVYSLEQIQRLQSKGSRSADIIFGSNPGDKFIFTEVKASDIHQDGKQFKFTVDSYKKMGSDESELITSDMMKSYEQRKNVTPIVVDEDNQIMDGRHRLAAQLSLGIKLIPVFKRIKGE